MYLSEINQCYKEAFLDLAYYFAQSDSVYSESERDVIDQYKKEMDITYNPISKKLTEILSSFSQASEREKKIVLFEIAALVIADGSYSTEEQNVLKEVNNNFRIADDFIVKAIKIIDEINILYYQSKKLIEEV
jgi:DnaJ-domain-containing protein 1